MGLTFFDGVISIILAILIITTAYSLVKRCWYEKRIEFNTEASVLHENLYDSGLSTPSFVVKNISLLKDCDNNGSPIAMYIIEATFPIGYGDTKSNTFTFYNTPNILQVGDVLTLEKVKETLKSDESLADS